ncbi:MAG: 50S ribosomal protein L29 [Nitrospiraceae bacterium]|nr:50S ribosomal protein L29 [Nitrospiraceae bacterium]
MKPAELKSSTVDELRAKEADLRKELFNLRFQQATGEIENPKRIWAVRKDIARLLTVITEKKKEGGK